VTLLQGSIMPVSVIFPYYRIRPKAALFAECGMSMGVWYICRRALRSRKGLPSRLELTEFLVKLFDKYSLNAKFAKDRDLR